MWRELCPSIERKNICIEFQSPCVIIVRQLNLCLNGGAPFLYYIYSFYVLFYNCWCLYNLLWVKINLFKSSHLSCCLDRSLCFKGFKLMQDVLTNSVVAMTDWQISLYKLIRSCCYAPITGIHKNCSFNYRKSTSWFSGEGKLSELPHTFLAAVGRVFGKLYTFIYSASYRKKSLTLE